MGILGIILFVIFIIGSAIAIWIAGNWQSYVADGTIGKRKKETK